MEGNNPEGQSLSDAGTSVACVGQRRKVLPWAGGGSPAQGRGTGVRYRWACEWGSLVSSARERAGGGCWAISLGSHCLLDVKQLPERGRGGTLRRELGTGEFQSLNKAHLIFFSLKKLETLFPEGLSLSLLVAFIVFCYFLLFILYTYRVAAFPHVDE